MAHGSLIESDVKDPLFICSYANLESELHEWSLGYALVRLPSLLARRQPWGLSLSFNDSVRFAPGLTSTASAQVRCWPPTGLGPLVAAGPVPSAEAS